MFNSYIYHLRFIIFAYCVLHFGLLSAQSPCIDAPSDACLGDSVIVTYVGSASPRASYRWTSSNNCARYSNPLNQYPQTVSFTMVGNCTLNLVIQEPGLPPETCMHVVKVHPKPEAVFSANNDTLICRGECTDLIILFSGTPPFRFTVQDSTGTNSYETRQRTYSLTVCPQSTNVYTITSLSDAFCTQTGRLPRAGRQVVDVSGDVGLAVARMGFTYCMTNPATSYTWMNCNDQILSNERCFEPPAPGCYRAISSNGRCADTLTFTFECTLACAISAPDTLVVGDTATLSFSGKYDHFLKLQWRVARDTNNREVDTLTGDSVKVAFDKPGCYPIQLFAKEGPCDDKCETRICVISKPCVCDENNTSLLRPVARDSNNNCCYAITGKISSFECFDSMQIICKSNGFFDIWVDVDGRDNWIARKAKDKSITLEDRRGYLPAGEFNAGTLCVEADEEYNITVYYFSSKDGKADTCTYEYAFNCKKKPPFLPICDGLESFIISLHTLPQFCCQNIHTFNPWPNTVTHIGVFLANGTFSSVSPDLNYNVVNQTSNHFSLVHNSGFIPTGWFTPASFCVNAAANPLQLIVRYYYSVPPATRDSCDFTFSFNCPNVAQPDDCCDSLKSVSLVNIGNPSACCFDLFADSYKKKCFSKISINSNSGILSNIQPSPGWIAQSTGPGSICFVPSAPFVPSGIINPGSFCVAGASNPFAITVDFHDLNGNVLPKCQKTFKRECPSPPARCSCDSLKAVINSTSQSPGICCHNITYGLTSNQNNCFSSIVVTTSAGSFTNVVSPFGYTVTPINTQQFHVVHSSGFLPTGTNTPVDFCVTGAAAYTIQAVFYFINSAGERDSCVIANTFKCEPKQDRCDCDALKSNVLITSHTAGQCCYDVATDIATDKCFTSMQVSTSAGVFTNITTAAGFNTGGGTQQYNVTHTSGSFPVGSYNPTSFCVTGATLYTITVTYFYTNNNNQLDSCVFQYTTECPSPPKACSCDSIRLSQVNPISVSPGLCCYQLTHDLPAGPCINSALITTNQGNFTNVNAAGSYNTIVSNQAILLTHQSGFLPGGLTTPLTFCVGGASFYTITVMYFFNQGGVLDTCVFRFTFDCPELPKDTTCLNTPCPISDRVWQQVGSAQLVYDMVVFQCKLIVAGRFPQINNVPASNIAAWDGYNWTPLGSGTNGPIRALEVHNGKLYAGGAFTSAGGNPNSNSIACWDGTSWSNLDDGVTLNTVPGVVHSLLSTSAGLVAAGQFNLAGASSNLPTSNIALWNGTSWSNNFNSSFNGPIYSLYEYGGDLVAGGLYTIPGSHIAKWNGSSWSAFSGPIDITGMIAQGVKALSAYQGNLIVGGSFANTNSIPNTQHISSWNGSSWNALAGGDISQVFGLDDFKVFENKLFVGGRFNMAGNSPMNSVAAWDGSTWSSTAHPYQLVHAVESYDSCGAQPCLFYSAGEGFVNRWTCVTGTKDKSDSPQFTIRPNPASDQLIVEWLGQNSPASWSCAVYRLDGRKTMQWPDTEKTNVRLDIGALPHGIYMLEVKPRNQKPVMLRFVKM